MSVQGLEVTGEKPAQEASNVLGEDTKDPIEEISFETRETPIDNETHSSRETDDDDDDFGDFNEEFDEFEEPDHESQPVVQNQRPVDEIQFNNYSDDDKKRIYELIGSIFPQKNKTNDGESIEDTQVDKFTLDERSESIYSRMIQEPHALRQINWKRSLIRRNLLLNLHIPIDLDEILPPVDKSRFSNIYDGRTIKEISKSREADLLQLIPKFEKLNIDDSLKEKTIEGTNERINEIYSKVQPLSYYEFLANDKETLSTKLEELKLMKEELIRLASCWSKNLEDIKLDNGLFSSYVENLVGNTQKKRRQNK
ncbi:hypothetical protein CANARDRAFT_100360 [[Candida] arabinofermentans NRRL YB-2248]|uniref:Uncharacterized protein n=1 Tax=[Candida] arabinofermentans NRRL YB-2248 TaxID=983967 RepID=A0A1E4SUU4_9ASCO|nr:hypothetical protein CANARDRAFT_100360 [[Candida] arabinofermentans NRRL YB-2248]